MSNTETVGPDDCVDCVMVESGVFYCETGHYSLAVPAIVVPKNDGKTFLTNPRQVRDLMEDEDPILNQETFKKAVQGYKEAIRRGLIQVDEIDYKHKAGLSREYGLPRDAKR